MTKLEELQSQINAIQAQIDALRQPMEWPQYGGKYFLLNPIGDILESTFNSPTYDTLAVAQGNAFRSEAEAERERDRRALLQELKPFRKGFVPDLGVERPYKFFIFYSNKYEQLSIGIDIACVAPASGYFRTREDVQAAIDHFGERLKILFEGA